MFWFFAGCTGALPIEEPPPTDTHDPPPPARLVLGQEPPCEVPSLRDLARFDRYSAWDQALEGDDNHIGLMSGGGVATGDFDGDGRLDVFLTRRSLPHLYLTGGAEGWASADDALPKIGENTASASVIDIDSDGDLDLFVGRYKHPNLLLVNDGSGQFSALDPAELGIVDDPEARTTGQAWADFDADGDVDLFLTNYGRPSRPADRAALFENLGDNTFAEHSQPLPADLATAHTFIAGWHDLDDDGWLDLYGVNDFGWDQPNVLMWNSGDGTFVEDDRSAFLDARHNCMGLGVGDLNRDGLPDLVMPAWNRIAVRISGGNRTWFDASEALGIRNDPSAQRQVSWGSEIADFDNDGDDDVFVAYGYINASTMNLEHQPDALFVNEGWGQPFEQQAETWQLADVGMSRGVVVADLNRDGWVDVLKANKDAPHALQLSRCGEAAWLRVSLRHLDGLNTFGLGAKVEIEADGARWWRRIGSGSTGLAGGQPPEVHFGLGDLDRIDRLTVTWPDHAVTSFVDLTTRQSVVVERLQ